MELVKIAVVIASLVCAVFGQPLPSCRSLRRDFRTEGVVLFRGGRNVPNACEQRCVNRNRLRIFYSCCPGFTAVVSNETGGLVDASTGSVVCLDLGLRPTPIIESTEPDVFTLPTEPTTATESTNATNATTATTASESTTASTESATASPAPTECPSSGPTSLQQYTIDSRDKVCVHTCQYSVAVQSVSNGFRQRTIYRCCEGEAVIASRALRLYSCP